MSCAFAVLSLCSLTHASRLSWWAQRNSCDEPNQEIDSFDNDVHHLIWNCSGQSALQHYKTDDQSASAACRCSTR